MTSDMIGSHRVGTVRRCSQALQIDRHPKDLHGRSWYIWEDQGFPVPSLSSGWNTLCPFQLHSLQGRFGFSRTTIITPTWWLAAILICFLPRQLMFHKKPLTASSLTQTVEAMLAKVQRLDLKKSIRSSSKSWNFYIILISSFVSIGTFFVAGVFVISLHRTPPSNLGSILPSFLPKPWWHFRNRHSRWSFVSASCPVWPYSSSLPVP